MRHATTGIALLASLLLFAAPASAVYVVTPLRAFASDNAIDAGDTVDVTIEPENETMAAEWRDRLVRVYYAYDTAESDEPDAPTSDETYRRVHLQDLTLDGDARGSFRWTAPEETDARNVALRIESEDGELLALVDIAVGDAPPVMRILAGGDGGAPEPVPIDEGNEGTPRDDAAVESGGNEKNVPSAGALAALAAVGLAAVALRRRG
ncbi:MAG TPA: hypothetical protein VFH78_00955 [Candidatus Thermoplasmatota archaeon]|nr:hypothetical protein [Candidatus Thermoplasmatota archaeon]